MAAPSPGPTFWHEPLLGTRVTIRVDGVDDEEAAAAASVMVAEFERLERVFSVFDQSSELCRWRRGELPGDRLDPGLVAVLGLAADTFARSGGAFSPVVGEQMARWRQAERSGVVPPAEELARLVVTTLPYRVVEGAIERVGRCDGVDLNAIAKGYIVDAATTAGLRTLPARASVLVNAGGEVLRRGPDPVLVGIEDPRTPYDNAAPMAVLRLADCALATSGPSRRGFQVGERWFGHVLDPRYAQPVASALSASVVAPTTAQADAVATVVGVLDLDQALAFTAALDGVGMAVLQADGTLVTDPVWQSHQHP